MTKGQRGWRGELEVRPQPLMLCSRMCPPGKGCLGAQFPADRGGGVGGWRERAARGPPTSCAPATCASRPVGDQGPVCVLAYVRLPSAHTFVRRFCPLRGCAGKPRALQE